MFHVQEADRITNHPRLATDRSYGNNGAFQLASPEPGWTLFLICSDGEHDDAIGELADWEHVSVSAVDNRRSRVPTWKEMAFIKNRYWDAEDCVVQFHPRASEYVNNHPSVLHMWRWKKGAFPVPPVAAV